MQLLIDDAIREKFPDLRIAILVATDIDNEGVDRELEQKKRAAADRFRADWTYERLTDLPEIQAWRNAYRQFGIKYKDSRPTAEAFLRRLIKGEPFPTISKAVDSYLLTETRYYLPVGGYDIDKIVGDVMLRQSPGGEEFTPIGGSKSETTREGEVVYADEGRILTRKWNFRDCDACKITPQSRNIVLISEAPFAYIDTARLAESMDHMAATVREHCGGTTVTQVLDRANAVMLAD